MGLLEGLLQLLQLEGGEDGPVPSLLLLLLGAQNASDGRSLNVLVQVALNESYREKNTFWVNLEPFIVLSNFFLLGGPP